jgi:hypothetical protein
MRLAVISLLIFFQPCVSFAGDNAACSVDPKKVENSCAPLSEKLLNSLRFATREQVTKAMKAKGQSFAENPETVHFISNAKKGESGVLNVTFRDGKAVILDAFINQAEGRPLQYLWNEDPSNSCSDLPNSEKRCNE